MLKGVSPFLLVLRCAVYRNFNLGGVGANFLATAFVVAAAALVSVNASLCLTNVVAALVVAGAVTNGGVLVLTGLAGYLTIIAVGILASVVYV